MRSGMASATCCATHEPSEIPSRWKRSRPRWSASAIGVLREVGDLVVVLGERRVAHVAVVEDDRPELLGERLLLEAPRAVVGREPHHAEQGVARATFIVEEAKTVHFSVGHAANDVIIGA